MNTNFGKEKNPCLGYDCYDPDMGCTMSSIDISYACPFEKNITTEFFMAMLPPTKTHQMKKARVVKGKPVFYEPVELSAVRQKLMAHLGKHVPEKKYTGAVRLVTKWCFPITGEHKDGEYKTTKPDTDNMIKLLKDCCTALGFWTDDSLVASEITEKFWADNPGIYVFIKDLI